MLFATKIQNGYFTNSDADAPKQPWRGMMLDMAYYFYDKDFVKKYPRLIEVSAWAGTDIHRLGGFYTRKDIKEVVAYAAVRSVEIIPEIEFPAHMLSAIVAYPWLKLYRFTTRSLYPALPSAVIFSAWKKKHLSNSYVTYSMKPFRTQLRAVSDISILYFWIDFTIKVLHDNKFLVKLATEICKYPRLMAG